MKRRALLILLTLALMLSMMPITALGASNLHTSDACASMIKAFEGFHKFPYWDNTQWTVGYGTRCPDNLLTQYKIYGISEGEAEALLKKELENFEKSVNEYDAKHGLNLTQNEFDALVSLSFNIGSAWMRDTSSTLSKAILENKTGNDVLFALGQWSMSGGSTNQGLVQRRLSEANVYLNGVYSKVLPSNYTYVQFDHTSVTYNGVNTSIRIQCYDSALTDTVRPVGRLDGSRFLGWYTKAEGGEWITTLDASTAGKTLYAHFQTGEGSVAADGTIQGTAASYKRTAQSGLNVYAAPSFTASVVRTLEAGAVLNIVADYVDGKNVKWGKLAEGGWVTLNASDPNGVSKPAQEKVIATGVVNIATGTLNIRSGAGTNYSKVGTLNKGEKIDIYEIKTVSGTQWGRISKGWVSLDYVKVTRVEETPAPTEPKPTEPAPTQPAPTQPAPTQPAPTEPKPTEPKPTEPAPTEPAKPKVIATGTVNISSGTLNVRSGAGSNYSKVGSLAKGAKVEIYEYKTVSGTKWGRISNGWISMAYVKLDTTSTETTQPQTQTGTVTATSLNVRSGAGTNYSIVATYKKGDTIKILETKKVSGVNWGRTDKGWVSMDYVKLTTSTGGSNTGKEEPKPTNPTTPTNPPAAATRSGTTTSTVNVRSGAGTNYSKVGSLAKGVKVNITSMKLVSNSAWGQISNGWVCLDYVKLNAPSSGCIVLVKATSLNVRSGAGTNYGSVGSYTKGDVVTVLETKTVGSTTWGRTAKGWISLDYAL